MAEMGRVGIARFQVRKLRNGAPTSCLMRVSRAAMRASSSREGKAARTGVCPEALAAGPNRFALLIESGQAFFGVFGLRQ